MRLDGPVPMGEQLAAGHEVTLAVLGPNPIQITIIGHKPNGSDNGCYVNHDAAMAQAGACLELAVPLSALGAASGTRLSFVIAVNRRAPTADTM